MKALHGEDGRVILENSDDATAEAAALRVHEATGETVSLIPFVLDGDAWVPDPANAVSFPEPEAKKAKKDAPAETASE